MRLTWSIMVCASSWLNNLRKPEPNMPSSVGVWQLFDTDCPCWCSHLLGVNRFAIGFFLSSYSVNPDLCSINSLSISYNTLCESQRRRTGLQTGCGSTVSVLGTLNTESNSRNQVNVSGNICQNKLKKYVELCVYVTVYVTVSL